jgi:hypothetical protein
MNNTRYVDFPNIGFLEVSLSTEELTPVLDEIKEIQKDFSTAIEHNTKLVGNISRSYLLIKSKRTINEILFKYLRKYDDITNYTQEINILTSAVPMIVDDPWVNFQLKNEFNPPHRHTGVISFVIWIKIPYNIEDEKKVCNSIKSAQPLAGHFSFHYNNALGELYHYHIEADKNMENKMLIFPAHLNHSVYPFYTSDEFRISVSGNVKFLV